MADKNYLNLSFYKDFSTIYLKSSEIQLFAIHDNSIVYCDNYKSSASSCGSDLQPYFEHKNAKQLSPDFSIKCTEFEGRIMEMEYCSCLNEFINATGLELCTLNKAYGKKKFRTTKYFDITSTQFPGILEKFVFHSTKTYQIYFLVKAISYTLIQCDLRKNFLILTNWDYLENDDNNNRNLPTTMNRQATTSNTQSSDLKILLWVTI
ncbi:unnamed protein product [Rotaria socialis]|uniref:Uncharacterized protein n=1 Tax=Rotaria socialis TaxID=392032 RepID=A0A821GGP8_9BILA|nr:unnamed protein product [Rotaria socialis]